MTIAQKIGGVPSAKFADPDTTAKGETRARVALDRLDTLWLNTGTLCNITCRNCYIESSPDNDRLAYITATEAGPFIAEAKAMGAREIGFTGGEPFLNPEIGELIGLALDSGLSALVLTNAMKPLMRPRVQEALSALKARAGSRLTLRISIDHFTAEKHDVERGAGAFAATLAGTDWLAGNGFQLAVAGRTCWGETEAEAREGYRRLFAARGWPIDAADNRALVLFPEMDNRGDVPEISLACWGILGKRPDQMMCAHSRMVVKRRGAQAPVVVPCTLLPYAPEFEMGASLEAAARADGGMFDNGAVKLCHRHCAKFCVLGGGSCS